MRRGHGPVAPGARLLFLQQLGNTAIEYRPFDGAVGRHETCTRVRANHLHDVAFEGCPRVGIRQDLRPLRQELRPSVIDGPLPAS
jgi:hypothetical protein